MKSMLLKVQVERNKSVHISMHILHCYWILWNDMVSTRCMIALGVYVYTGARIYMQDDDVVVVCLRDMLMYLRW